MGVEDGDERGQALTLGVKLSYALPRLACSLFSQHVGGKARKYYTGTVRWRAAGPAAAEMAWHGTLILRAAYAHAASASASVSASVYVSLFLALRYKMYGGTVLCCCWWCWAWHDVAVRRTLQPHSCMYLWCLCCHWAT